MTTLLQIDLVSDISCPWCAVGLSALAVALERLDDDTAVRLALHPFELNPQLGPGGQDIGEHLTEKYGTNAEQQAQIRQTIGERGAAVGFVFHPDGRGRVYNTFDAHRLLHWAGEAHPQRQLALKMALLLACHRDRLVMDDPAVLVQAAIDAGLDAAEAHAILASDAHAQAVRESEAFFTRAGIRAVPAVIVNQRHLIAGAQTPEAYEQALREIAAQAAA